MRLLHHVDGRPPAEVVRGDLVDLYRWSTSSTRSTVRSNFVATLDGSVQGLDGRAGSINTESDHEVFAVHRALADVILVGAGTVRGEHYRAVDLQPWQRSVREAEGLAPYPTLAVITGSLSIDLQIAEPPYQHGPVIAVTRSGHDQATLAAFRDHGAELLVAPGAVDLAWVIDQLAERRLTRVLCEGGPSVHRDLLAAGLLDEMSLTLAPNAVGGVGHRSTSGDGLPERADFDLSFVLLGEDQTLFTSYRRRG